MTSKYIHYRGHNFVVYGKTAKDVQAFFDDNVGIDEHGAITSSLSFARSVPIPPDILTGKMNNSDTSIGPDASRNEASLAMWYLENWGTYSDALWTSHNLSLEGNRPKVTYQFSVMYDEAAYEWVAKLSLKYPKLVFELEPYGSIEDAISWHDGGGSAAQNTYISYYKDGLEVQHRAVDDLYALEGGTTS
jgi:hypothetical protein